MISSMIPILRMPILRMSILRMLSSRNAAPSHAMC